MTKCTLPIHRLSFIPKLVRDYYGNTPLTKNLYLYPPTIDGLLESMESKSSHYDQRTLLAKVVEYNYPNKDNLFLKEKENLSSLLQNGLAVTTAHQPNLFLGPMYTLTKAISVLSLASTLNFEQSKWHISPVFIIGSEDHDKEELLSTSLFGKKFEWTTPQIGSVGQMRIDESLTQTLESFLNQFGGHLYADELKQMFREAYSEGMSLAQAFATMLRKLLGQYGIIVLDMNIPQVKNEMKDLFRKDLMENIALKVTKNTIAFLETNYHVQAKPLEYNLFQYKAGERIKIKAIHADLMSELELHPENFSPSVILRPLMQQKIIPSIANVGGAAEVSYWLELKDLFQSQGLDLPVILLRDLFSTLDDKSWDKWKNSDLEPADFFHPIEELKTKLALKETSLENDKTEVLKTLDSIYKTLENKLQPIENSLIATVRAEKAKSQKSIDFVFGKAIKAIKNKEEARLNSLIQIKEKVFSQNSLTERTENFSSYYIRYGPTWIDALLKHANPLAFDWKLI